MRGADCGAVADGLGGVLVGGVGGVVGAVDLLLLQLLLRVDPGRCVRTLFMAFWTRSEVIRPFEARLSIRASFEAPELRQAMLMCLAAGRAVDARLLLLLADRIDWKSLGTANAATMVTRVAMRVRECVLNSEKLGKRNVIECQSTE